MNKLSTQELLKHQKSTLNCIFEEFCTENMWKKYNSSRKVQKTCPGTKQLENIKNQSFFLKIARNDVKDFDKLYIKFNLKRLKNRFLMNILMGLGFFIHPVPI